MAIRFRRRLPVQNEVLGTYSFPSRTVQVLRTRDDRILWTCDCERFHRQMSSASRCGASTSPRPRRAARSSV